MNVCGSVLTLARSPRERGIREVGFACGRQLGGIGMAYAATRMISALNGRDTRPSIIRRR